MRYYRKIILNWQNHIRLYETLVESSDHLYGVQNPTIIENVVEPITSLQTVKNQSDKFKTQTGTGLIYEKYSELLLSAETTHENKFKWDSKFWSKYQRSVYEIGQLLYSNYEVSFDIDSSVDTIQEYYSQQQSSSSIITK